MLAPPKLERTPSCHRGACAGVWCLERGYGTQDARTPVKLVVFDCDETLTISTFMPREVEFASTIGWCEWPEYISSVNFESPFTEGSRLEKLRNLLNDLSKDDDGREAERGLAVLTRNERGAIACLNLLMMAGLANYFCVIWSMPKREGMPAGVYRHEDKWMTFDAPLADVFDHKAEVLACVVKQPDAWLPMLAHGQYLFLKTLKIESVVLVDDVRTNFQSPNSRDAKLLRYCKVARFDGHHPQMGFVADMGGIGAMSSSDFQILKHFVRKPWEFKAASSLECMEATFENCLARPMVHLVVFEFDQVISLCTFVIEESQFSKEIGYSCPPSMKEKSILYNFESPYVNGSRVAKLDKMLYTVSAGGSRTLAILTENTTGAVAVLNLLLLANLAHHFRAIWAPMAEQTQPTGVYRDGGGKWLQFKPPEALMRGRAPRAELICSIVDKPKAFFPQLLKSSPPEGMGDLLQMSIENILAVDDERTNFIANHMDNQSVPRYCRVGRFDDDYRDQGFIVHMGGIGAKNDYDYEELEKFVEKPWRYRVVNPEMSPDQMMALVRLPSQDDLESPMVLERRVTEDTILDSYFRRSITMGSLAKEDLH